MAPATATAQAMPLLDAIAVGAWTFRPLVDVRIRGEYRQHPFDRGGVVYGQTAVLFDEDGTTLPTVALQQPGVIHHYFIAERSRLGLAIDRGPVTAAVTLQDGRVWGDSSTSLVAPGTPALPSFAPYEAYIDAHTRSGRHVFLRVGRQKVSWGDGRLLGANDWSVTGRSLDAVRFGFQLGDLDVELLASMLAAPGRYTSSKATTSSVTQGLAEGPGAELYGLNAVYHALPLLNLELTGLARVVRLPSPSALTPSDTFVIEGRVSGDRRGVQYAIEGAYELGRVAANQGNRDLRAFALAARLGWETTLPAHLTFHAEGAYASGDRGQAGGTLKRFDPILPDEHTWLGPMSLFAWSNLIFGGGAISARPIEALNLSGGYRYAALAEPGGRWTDAALTPIGAVSKNTSQALGHEIDAAIRLTPWQPLEIETGYAIFFSEAGAEAILAAAGRPSTLQHWAYLQTMFRAP